MEDKAPPANKSTLECLFKAVFGCSFLVAPVLYLVMLADMQALADNGCERAYDLIRSVVLMTFYTSIVCFVIAGSYGLLLYKLLSVFRLNNRLSSFLIGALPGALLAYPAMPKLGVVTLVPGISVALTFHYLQGKNDEKRAVTYSDYRPGSG